MGIELTGSGEKKQQSIEDQRMGEWEKQLLITVDDAQVDKPNVPLGEGNQSKAAAAMPKTHRIVPSRPPIQENSFEWKENCVCWTLCTESRWELCC